MESSMYIYNPTTLGVDKEPIQGIKEDGKYSKAFETVFGNWKMTQGTNYYYRTFEGDSARPEFWVATPWCWCYGSSYSLRNI